MSITGESEDPLRRCKFQGARDIVRYAAGMRPDDLCCLVCLLNDELENIIRRFSPDSAIRLPGFEGWLNGLSYGDCGTGDGSWGVPSIRRF